MTLKNLKWLKSESVHPNHPGDFKWRTVIGLILIYTAVALNWQWIWSVLFLYWIAPDFFTGVTYFIEPVSRQHNPILYWLILVTWVAFSVVMIFPDNAGGS